MAEMQGEVGRVGSLRIWVQRAGQVGRGRVLVGEFGMVPWGGGDLAGAENVGMG